MTPLSLNESSAPSRAKAFKRTVLILAPDLFAEIGGGQTAYRAIIAGTPDTLYYYFRVNEKPDAQRPAHCRALPLLDVYDPNIGDWPAGLLHFYDSYFRAWQAARSFAEAAPGVDIDVIDAPDYTLDGLFIKGAMAAHGVRVGQMCLALHGTISSALRDDWGGPAPRRELAQLRLRERLHYRLADARYALSAAYAEDLTRQSGGFVANLIDPLLMVGPFAPVVLETDDLPTVAFVGRRERRKGPDLFIDALWSQNRARYKKAIVIGPDSQGPSGVSSSGVLQDMANARGLDVALTAKLPREELDALYMSTCIVMLPSRYDQFNLVALESLRLGAPTLVSNAAGVARWIFAHLPELSDLVFRLDGGREGASRLAAALEDHKALRQRVAEAITKRALRADASTLEVMYRPADITCSTAHRTVREMQARLDAFCRPRERPDGAVGKGIGGPPALPAWKRAIIDSPLRPAAELYHHTRVKLQATLVQGAQTATEAAIAENAISDRAPRALAQLQQAIDIEGLRANALRLPERTLGEANAKRKALSAHVEHALVARESLFRELARLERRCGNDAVAAAYAMRWMRWAGQDRAGDLPDTLAMLRAHGFGPEAIATQALHSKGADQPDQIAALLQDSLARHRAKQPGPFAHLDDRRGAIQPRVAVIVSLYNAAAKTPAFLSHLSAQTCLRDGDLEVILVDSGSPADEYGAFKAAVAKTPLPIVYARTAERETIQAAWNRGIGLARAGYLSFLGVDEGVHPDGYRQLADALDGAPHIDWMMADSVVTAVDSKGAHCQDVMTYNRRGYDQSLVYLETCYLSWVGGLYRRSIHDRFGFYDESFRGAGDTEFKCRLLPFLKSAHLEKPLGLFLNYPEERTTQHPRAEIEDQRAWYLYRTPPGVAYVWDNRPIADVEAFFRRCLVYRKSYCGHLSTDFDMADAMARYMVARGENAVFAAQAMQSAQAMLGRMRALDRLDYRLAPQARRAAVTTMLAEAKRQEAEDQSAFNLDARPRYEIFNDNRYEQHWYSWSG
jgi:glycosyltransferase involved in cell wall biosynthesis